MLVHRLNPAQVLRKGLIVHPVFQARVHMPWFLQRSWELSVLRASTGWTFSLNTRNIRPRNDRIFLAAENGNVEYIIESLRNKEASIYDVDIDGHSLLDVSCGLFRSNVA